MHTMCRHAELEIESGLRDAVTSGNAVVRLVLRRDIRPHILRHRVAVPIVHRFPSRHPVGRDLPGCIAQRHGESHRSSCREPLPEPHDRPHRHGLEEGSDGVRLVRPVDAVLLEVGQDAQSAAPCGPECHRACRRLRSVNEGEAYPAEYWRGFC
eukprot:scaffold69223_cov60-Phaeocystis_antarctica.AAC.4